MLTHKGTKSLYTERLVLRRFNVSDAGDMFYNWASDEKVTQFLTWKPHESVDATRQLLEGWVEAYDNLKTYNWVMQFDGKAVIDYLFSEIGVNRVGISHAVENPASGKVAQKCGMTYEGTKREYFKTSTGKFVDIVDYGILKREWINNSLSLT